MASKIFLICALACAIQGISAIPRPTFGGNSELSLNEGIFSDSIGEFKSLERQYRSIIDRFENVVQEKAPEAEFAGYFNNILEMFENFAEEEEKEQVGLGNSTDVIRKCIRAQRRNMKILVARIEKRIEDARNEVRRLAIRLLGPYVEKAREQFAIIAEAVTSFPAKIIECIRERDVMKAIQVVRNTRAVIRQSALNVEEILKQAGRIIPQIRDQAMIMRQQILEEAREGLEFIRNEIRKCIQAGGPLTTDERLRVPEYLGQIKLP